MAGRKSEGEGAMSPGPRCVAAVHDLCGEGAVWDAGRQTLYWTDINRFLIHAYVPLDGSVRTWEFSEPVTALSLTDAEGLFLVALASKLIFWEPDTDFRRDQGFRLPGSPEVRLNDGRADPTGSFWIGSMENNVGPNGEPGPVNRSAGVLYRIDPDGLVSAWREELGISNTLCWSPDRKRFYFGDTLVNEIRVYDYDEESGSISNERPFLPGFGRGVPDGSAIDSAGYLWNCRYFGTCIVRVAPDGEIDRVVEMPTQNLTTCTFGDADLRTLYVTSAGLDTTPDDRQAGNLFALRVELPGMPENKFRYPL